MAAYVKSPNSFSIANENARSQYTNWANNASDMQMLDNLRKRSNEGDTDADREIHNLIAQFTPNPEYAKDGAEPSQEGISSNFCEQITTGVCIIDTFDAEYNVDKVTHFENEDDESDSESLDCTFGADDDMPETRTKRLFDILYHVYATTCLWTWKDIGSEELQIVIAKLNEVIPKFIHATPQCPQELDALVKWRNYLEQITHSRI